MRTALCGAGKAEERLHQRQAKSQDQGEVPEFDDHEPSLGFTSLEKAGAGGLFLGMFLCCSRSASATSGGM
jgi:hypothetical protein